MPTPLAQAPKPPSGYSNSVVGPLPSPRLFATGGNAATNAADFNNSTPVITEIYLAEILVTHPVMVQGLAVFAGSVWSDNIKAALYDASGTILAATASTAGNTTADAYQRIPIASEFQSIAGTATAGTQVFLAPGTYYAACILDGTTSRLNTHVVGSFGAGKLTGHVYATAFATTALTVTPPVTFTTALGPVISLY